MTRKRSPAFRRADRHRKRSRARIPISGWLVFELATLAGVKPRAVRYLVSQGILHRPKFRGTATRYDREHLVTLLAVTRWRRSEKVRYEVIRQRLRQLSARDIEAGLLDGGMTEAVKVALGHVMVENSAEHVDVPLSTVMTLPPMGAGELHLRVGGGVTLIVRFGPSGPSEPSSG